MENKPLQPKELQGVFTALITPMSAGNGLDNGIDYEKLYMLVNDQVKAGIDGLVIAGTTGQSATLDKEEQVELIRRVFEYTRENHGEGIKIIAGASSNCTREAIYLSRQIEDTIGPTTLLHLTGYYNNPTQRGLFEHFSAIARALDGSNIILYNVPGRTNSNIEATTALKLSCNPKFIGIKEASGKLEQVAAIISGTSPRNFRVVSGEDHLVAKIMEMGGYGVISASANIAPVYFVKIAKACLEKNYEEAYRLQEEVMPLIKEGVFRVKNPIPLAHMFNTELRLPMTKEPQIEAELEKVLGKYTQEQLGIDVGRYRS